MPRHYTGYGPKKTVATITYQQEASFDSQAAKPKPTLRRRSRRVNDGDKKRSFFYVSNRCFPA